MTKKGKPKVLIFDFNIVYDLLAGSSVLAHLKNDSIFQYEIVFNRSCALEDRLIDLGFKTHRLTFSPENKFKQIIDLLLLIPRIIYLHALIKPDLLHANNALAARFGAIYKIIFGVPLITHIRNPRLPPRTYWICWFTDRFACTSDFVSGTALDKRYHKNVDVVYDGFDIDSLLSKPKISSVSEIRFGMCSRLTQQKGVDSYCDLAHSLSSNKSYLFYHAGAVPSIESKDAYISGLAAQHINTVHWYGYIEDIESFWRNIDIAIFPAREDEAFGRVVAEAMAKGIPVISTKCGGPEEIIENGVSGFLVDRNDLYALIECSKLLASDINLRERIGKQARLRVLNKFSSAAYIKRLHSCYKRVLNKVA